MRLFLTLLICLLAFARVASADPVLRWSAWPGPVFWEDAATGEGIRTQAVGPIYERMLRPEETVRTIRPFWIDYHTHGDYLTEGHSHVLYPLFSQRRFRDGKANSFLYLLRFGHSGDDGVPGFRRRELFPIYFDYRTDDPETSYRALFPIHGTLRNRLFYDRLSWTLFPLYSEWERNEVVNHSVVWPFIRWRTGGEHRGWAFWPLHGYFEKPGVYEHRYALWPFYYNYRDFEPEKEARHRFGVLPFYTRESRPDYISEIYLWPFFGYTDRQDPDYHEIRYFWPFLVQGRGERTYVNRWAPVYTHSIRRGIDKKWVLWPLYNERAYMEADLEVRVQRVLYILYWRMTQEHPDFPEAGRASKTHLWPLYSHWNGGDGQEQFQLLSPLQVWFPKNRKVRDLYDPLFALYRYRQEEETRTHNFLFSLLIYQSQPEQNRLSVGPLLDVTTGQGAGFSLLSGLFEVRSASESSTRKFRLFWLDL